MSSSSSSGSRLWQGLAARSSVSASTRCRTARPASLSQPSSPIRPRSRIPPITAASCAAGRWWMRPDFSAWHVHAGGEQDVSLKAAGTLGHQGRDVPVATVLAQQGACTKQAGHHAVGDRDRAQRGVHGPSLVRGAFRSLGRRSAVTSGAAATSRGLPHRWIVKVVAVPVDAAGSDDQRACAKSIGKPGIGVAGLSGSARQAGFQTPSVGTAMSL